MNAHICLSDREYYKIICACSACRTLNNQAAIDIPGLQAPRHHLRYRRVDISGCSTSQVDTLGVWDVIRLALARKVRTALRSAR